MSIFKYGASLFRLVAGVITSDKDVQVNADLGVTGTVNATQLAKGGLLITADPGELNQLDGVLVGGNNAGDILTTDVTQTVSNKTFSDGTSFGAKVSVIGDLEVGDVGAICRDVADESITLSGGDGGLPVEAYIELYGRSHATRAKEVRIGNTASDNFIFDPDGSLLMPKQPAFFGYKGADQLNIDSTGWQKVTFTELFDTNGDFASSIFTAPHDGVYQFSATLYMGTDSEAAVAFVKNGTAEYQFAWVDQADSSTRHCSGSILMQLDAGETMQLMVNSLASTFDIESAGSGSAVANWFSGHLVG